MKHPTVISNISTLRAAASSSSWFRKPLNSATYIEM
jgi:hypothetical protein